MNNTKIENVLKDNTKLFKILGSKKDNIQVLNQLCLVASSAKISSEKVLNTLIQESSSNIAEIVGYTIKNIGNETIKNILLPIYVEKDSVFKGEVKQFSLRPGETLSLPTKWLILLLSRVEYGFQVSNGSFIKKENIKDGDIDLRYKQYNFSKELEPTLIGARFTTTRLNYVLSEYQKIFGYLCNKLNLKEVEINSNAARFLSIF